MKITLCSGEERSFIAEATGGPRVFVVSSSRRVQSVPVVAVFYMELEGGDADNGAWNAFSI
jgi:hypothetical protein